MIANLFDAIAARLRRPRRQAVAVIVAAVLLAALAVVLGFVVIAAIHDYITLCVNAENGVAP
jgi:predicted PurR-regulated permease PerM